MARRSWMTGCVAAALLVGATAGARGDVDRAGDVTAADKVPITVPLEGGLRLEYEGYFGGLHIGSARAVLEREGARYRVSAEARARGILEWFSEYRGEAETRGALAARDAAGLDGRAPKPDIHRNRGEWQGDERWVALDYDEAGRVATRDGSPPEEEEDELTPIPEGATTDTIDPISAIVALAGILENGGTCDTTLKLYDGRRRYDLTVADGGEKRFAPNDYSIFAGSARACALSIERIGGFRVDRSKYSKTARERTVWVGRPIEAGPPVPVRVEVETAYGTLVIHLVAAHAGERRIALEPGRDVMADE